MGARPPRSANQGTGRAGSRGQPAASARDGPVSHFHRPRPQAHGSRVAGMQNQGDGFPSPSLRTDSRSALPREIRAWRRLRVIKRDETFSLIFLLPETVYMELELRTEEVRGAHEIGGRTLGGHPPLSWTGLGPPGVFLSPRNSY